MSGIYKLNREVQFEFNLTPDWSDKAYADMDILVTSPSGIATYTNSGATGIIASTSTSQGIVFYAFTPDVVGLWTVELMIGAGAAAVSLHRAEVFVVDIPVTEWENCYQSPPLIFGTFENWRMRYQILGTDWDDAKYSPLTSSAMAFDSYGIDISPDGTKFFFLVGQTYMELWRFDMTTPWDLSTLTYHSHGVMGTLSKTTRAYFKIKSDGFKVLLLTKSSRVIYSFEMTTAWDASTIGAFTSSVVMTYNFIFGAVSEDGVTALSFASLAPYGQGHLLEYTAGLNPWNASQYIQTGKSFDIGTPMESVDIPEYIPLNPEPYAMATSNNGEYFYILANFNSTANPDLMYTFKASTPWDISTLSLLTTSSDPALVTPVQKFWGKLGERAQDIFVRDFTEFNDVYVHDNNSSTLTNISQYGVFTAGFFKRNQIIGVQWNALPGTPPATLNNLLSFAAEMNMTIDGLRLFIMSSGIIYGFTLSTAFDLDTVTYVGASSLLAVATSINFNSDGTVLLTGSSTALHKYTLSTAWDLSTISLVSTNSTPNVDTNNAGIATPDGTVYLTADHDDIREISMSTAYDTTTQTITGNLINITALKTPPADTNVRRYTASLGTIQSMNFNEDGTVLAVVFGYSTVNPDLVGDSIYLYSLSTPYDITTATLTNGADPYDLYETKQRNTVGIAFNTSLSTYITMHDETANQTELTTHQLVL